MGREIDSLDEDEQRVIANILDLHEILVRDIMTPRIVSEFVSPESTISEVIEKSEKSQFSRYPVIDSSETPLGILFRYDLIKADKEQPVSSIMKPVTVVLDKINVETLMSQLMKERQHMFLVYDEYGSWQGVVTMEDVIETIIGKPIMDETDDIPSMRRHAKLRWKHRLKNLDNESP